MGFLEEIAEAARQVATQDDWYFKNEPYILELRSNVFGIPTLSYFMVLPHGPEEYGVIREFRQTVTPTLGGLVAEERGLLWRKIHVAGSFGLAPKLSSDTSALGPDPTIVVPGLGGVLSGPAWTRRMVRNFFERYGELKADPLTASDTVMVWHDTKLGDSFVVVPESIAIERTNARRMQYPWSFDLIGTAKDEGLVPTPVLSESVTAIGSITNAVATVNKGLSLVNSAIIEGSRILGEIRGFIAAIDSVVNKLDVIATSAQSFVDGVNRTIDVGKQFITDTIADLDGAIVLMEATPEIPNEVRQNYQMAADGLDAIAAQNSAFGDTYQDAAAGIAASEAGVGGETQATLDAAALEGPPGSAAALASTTVRASDADLAATGALAAGRTFASYSGFRTYEIKSTDTLQSIAAAHLGDGALWYDIAIVNDLKAPYISRTGAPGTVRPGETITIPTLTGRAPNAVVAGEGSEPGEELLGVDFALQETPSSAAGRPSVDLAIDRRTFRDFATIRGFGNYAQALQLRLWTEQGHMPLIPLYGFPRVIGVKSTGAFLALLRIAYERSIRQDSRTETIGPIRFEAVDDVIEVNVDVVPIGSNTTRAVSTSLV